MRIEGSSHGELRYPEWQKIYHDALLEPNPQKLVQRVNEAETAILSRLQEIRLGSDSRMEAQAIEDALNGLRVLKNETAKFKRSQNASPHYNTIQAESD
jgi:hypothetical protein